MNTEKQKMLVQTLLNQLNDDETQFCESYPLLFQNAVKNRPAAWVKRNQEWSNHDPANCCGLCNGNPRFYHFERDDGSIVNRCGGYTIVVPGITSHDIPAVVKLISEQDQYFEDYLN